MTEANRLFYDRISGAYDFIADANEHKARELGEEMLDVQAGERVLEIGFGTGNALVDLAGRVGDGGRVEGVDVSPGMMSEARRKVARAGLEDRVGLTVADARRLDFADGSFDAAFASFTLELFEPDDIPGVLGQLRRVLRGGGRLVVVSMAAVAKGEQPSLLENAYVWMHRHFPHIVDCRPIDSAALLADAGFEVKERRDLKIWTMPVAAVLATRD